MTAMIPRLKKFLAIHSIVFIWNTYARISSANRTADPFIRLQARVDLIHIIT